MEPSDSVEPQGSQFQIFERVMVAHAGMQFERLGPDSNVMRFVTLGGRAYEFFVDDAGRSAIIKELTGGIEVATTMPPSA